MKPTKQDLKEFDAMGKKLSFFTNNGAKINHARRLRRAYKANGKPGVDAYLDKYLKIDQIG